MPYRLSALAEQDLDEIWSYVAEDANAATADRLIDVNFDRFELLVEQPRMGRNRPEFGEGVRSFVVESYVIYYRNGQDLLIARVLHGRRDQAAAWSECRPVFVFSSTRPQTNVSSETRFIRVAAIGCSGRRVGTWRHSGDGGKRRAEVEARERDSGPKGRDSRGTLAGCKLLPCNEIWLGVRDGIRNWLVTAA